jgi:hypothetical protein
MAAEGIIPTLLVSLDAPEMRIGMFKGMKVVIERAGIWASARS